MLPQKGLLSHCSIILIIFLGASVRQGIAAEVVSFRGEQLWPEPKAIMIKGVLSKPDGHGPFPAVILLPNCGGPNKFEFAKFWPAYLNKLGYVTLNVDHFTPRKGTKCSKRFTVTPKTIAQDAYGALTYLDGLSYVDTNRIAVFGSSLGALAINWFGSLGKSTSTGLTFKASVSLYPSHCKRVSASPAIIPSIIIVGDKEKGVASCKALSQESGLTVHVFPETYHGFDQPSATRLKNAKLREDHVGNKRLYSKSATEKAKILVKEYLATKLSAPTPEAKTETSHGPKLGKIRGKDPYMAVKRRDTDGDGKVSSAEWEKSSDLFSKIDIDSDGFITAQEFYVHWLSRQ